MVRVFRVRVRVRVRVRARVRVIHPIHPRPPLQSHGVFAKKTDGLDLVDKSNSNEFPPMNVCCAVQLTTCRPNPNPKPLALTLSPKPLTLTLTLTLTLSPNS
jgi:hypothetical protein